MVISITRQFHVTHKPTYDSHREVRCIHASLVLGSHCVFSSVDSVAILCRQSRAVGCVFDEDVLQRVDRLAVQHPAGGWLRRAGDVNLENEKRACLHCLGRFNLLVVGDLRQGCKVQQWKLVGKEGRGNMGMEVDDSLRTIMISYIG